MVSLDAVTVLTTPERSDAFKAVYGPKADYRFDYQQTTPLRDFLGNLALGGGAIAVIDEAHFVSSAVMLKELRAYSNDPRWRSRRLRLIVVCLGRCAGDVLLAELVMCCGIHDVVYGMSWTEAVIELNRLLECCNDRFDVLELIPSTGLISDKQHLDSQSCDDLKLKEQTLLNHELVARGSFSIKITVAQESEA